MIVVSQSGETADTLTAIKQSKARGSHILIITNRPDSAMAREALENITKRQNEIANSTVNSFYETQI